ncbi:MAG TPA: VCBS repeat-containing protein [Polyangiaceae bacterium]|nr:MAG: FG-GAP repeat protein [Deltaproteobacteria bacterium ADurb.Bin207]HNS96323.1 VCBS repeat-containing protein [Polyangiaceae bacterium]HNZ22055.1 VCBS repeat-containing protein [Polyangiaceae bacterium]HOD22189.1 VCBS repeat-containing protein [Polyangiaceae bacterium]HOE47363.1 VCBS repeat-containing protein [Polyangiaceae bacterium]
MLSPRTLTVACFLLGLPLLPVACGSSEDNSASSGSGGKPSDAGSEDGTGGTGGAVGGSGGTGGGVLIDASNGCKSAADCDGGVCLPSGVCCESADRACGDVCCQAGDACLFGACVTPGDICFTPADCPDGHYCEPALGSSSSPDAGSPDAAPPEDGGPICTQDTPPSGRCVPAPIVCDDKGQPPGCVEPCEYKPKPGALRTVVKWQWGMEPKPTEYQDFADVWATPAVARIYDANCDGKVDLADPPNIVFVSGNAKRTCCSCSGDAVSTCLTGVLRMLDGRNGREIWSLPKASATSTGFAGMSVAVGDVDGDQLLDIIAMTGEGHIAVINHDGTVKAISTEKADGHDAGTFGWGGGIAIGDMDNDGRVEIAYGRTLFSYNDKGQVERLWVGTAGSGSGLAQALSHFVDLDGDGTLELLAGRTAYRKDGSMLWNNSEANGFTAVGDFDGDGLPDVVVVHNGTIRILKGLDGTILLGPLTLPGTGSGGPPTVADFDGDGKPEIGVAQQNLYSMLKPDFTNNQIKVVWSQTNHDMSSSVTGSSVFDFQGDGKAEVIYNDECYLWVYDGADGSILYTDFTQSFTATESSIVADVDGDGHAELVKIANGANPNTWSCAHHDEPGKIVAPHTEPFPVWQPAPSGDYRGITVLGDVENAWVGTRTLWNQHAYEVTNICDPRDSACESGSYYGQIPKNQKPNWKQPWLNNFRQNVQDKGVFDAPDATVSLSVSCRMPVPLTVSVRNMGLSGLPAGVEVGLFRVASPDQHLGSVFTSIPLLPGQTEVIEYDAQNATTGDTFFARILVDPATPTFRECRDDNNESQRVTPSCVQ